VGEQRLSEPSSKEGTLTLEHAAVVEDLKISSLSILDGFLKEKSEVDTIYNAVRELWKSGGMHESKTGGGPSGLDELSTGFRDDLIKWAGDAELRENPNLTPVHGYVLRLHEFLKPIVNEFEKTKGLYTERGDAMMTCYPGNGAKYKRHSDNPHGNSRLLTCILYLNPDWKSEDGGQLNIKSNNLDLKIEPLLNRLIIFWSEGNLHEVLSCYKERFAITVWVHDSKVKVRAKEEHLAVGTTG